MTNNDLPNITHKTNDLVTRTPPKTLYKSKIFQKWCNISLREPNVEKLLTVI